MQSHLDMQAEENRENGMDAQEARYAARRQFGNVTLALGIGANTSIFSFINAILLRPLPVREPDRMVSVYHRNVKQGSLSSSSYRDFEYYRKNNSVFSGMLAYLRGGQDILISPPESPAERRKFQVDFNVISPDYFLTVGLAL